jgi:murein DD-endopeptidase MepM/ murein hydrolase activator NlpD
MPAVRGTRLTRGAAVVGGLIAAGAGSLAAAGPANAPVAANMSAQDQLEVPEPTPTSTPVFPVEGGVDFGEGDARFGAWRGGRKHEGQDVFAPAGTPLLAALDGVVLETGDDGGRGNYVAIFSPERRATYLYLHMRRPPRVEPGEPVRAGDRVGAIGCTGSCFGDHLHFELRRGRGTQGAPVDPLPLLRRWKRG